MTESKETERNTRAYVTEKDASRLPHLGGKIEEWRWQKEMSSNENVRVWM